MQTKAAIYETLKGIFNELFEIDPSDIELTMHLYDDLDIDSIDAVDMIVKLKELTGKKLQPSDFKEVRTVEDVVNAVFKLLNEDQFNEPKNEVA